MNSLNTHDEMKRLISRAGALFAALALGSIMAVTSLLLPAAASADTSVSDGGQVQTRSIEMSTSEPGATAKYDVTFTSSSQAVSDAAAIKNIVIEFCAGDSSPIIGDSTCNAPTGFDASGVSLVNNPDGAAISNLASVSGWTVGATTQVVKLTGASAVTLSSTVKTFNFELDGIVNPDQPNYTGGTGSFYARVVTYTSAQSAGFTSYAPGNEGTYEDYGGFALSTASVISITAKVQETLTFCMSGPVAGGTANPLDGTDTNGDKNCDATNTAITAPNLTIGHGGLVKTIDNSQIDTASAFMQLSTNATHGAIIRMHSSNSCTNGGLSADGGADCSVPGVGATAGQLAAAVPNTGGANFGLFVGAGYTTTGVAASTGVITPSATYNDGTGTLTNLPVPAPGDIHFGMDNNTTTGVESAYGNQIASTGGAPCNTVNSQLVFGAIASLTTPAGIYQANESLIATGTF